jgi:hypothetical protein
MGELAGDGGVARRMNWRSTARRTAPRARASRMARPSAAWSPAAVGEPGGRDEGRLRVGGEGLPACEELARDVETVDGERPVEGDGRDQRVARGELRGAFHGDQRPGHVAGAEPELCLEQAQLPVGGVRVDGTLDELARRRVPPVDRLVLHEHVRRDRLAGVERQGAPGQHDRRVAAGAGRAVRGAHEHQVRRPAVGVGVLRIARVGALELGERPCIHVVRGDSPKAIRCPRSTAARAAVLVVAGRSSRARSALPRATSSASATSAATTACTANGSAGDTTRGSPAQRVVPSATRTSTGLTCTRGSPPGPAAQRTAARARTRRPARAPRPAA